MDLLQQLAAIILPVLAVPIGCIWARSGNSFDNRFVTQLVTNISTPALAVMPLRASASRRERWCRWPV
jgi:hypothetical protein